MIICALLNLDNDLTYDYENQLRTIALINNVQEQEKAFKYFYENTFRPDLLKVNMELHTKTQLLNIVDSFYDITFYIQNESITKEYLKYFDLLRNKQWTIEKHYQEMYGALIKSRMSEQAKTFHQKYHQFNLSDNIDIKESGAINPSQIHVLNIGQSDERSLEREPFNFSSSYEIIVSAHPGCHFTVRAVNEIKNDVSLTRFFKNQSRWLLSPSVRWYFTEVVEWNLLNPEFHIKYVDMTQDFPMIDFWGTPSFYFLKNGIVVDKLIGWPQEGKIKELKLLIEKYFPEVDYD